jgi:predicted tellurium resistance membrane protein TerC
VTQIAFVDIIFSLDSVITAVGMADQLWVMVAAVMIAMALMITAANPLAEFVSRHPTVKMLALSFLLLIGTVLIADGLHFHIPKGYGTARSPSRSSSSRSTSALAAGSFAGA